MVVHDDPHRIGGGPREVLLQSKIATLLRTKRSGSVLTPLVPIFSEDRDRRGDREGAARKGRGSVPAG